MAEHPGILILIGNKISAFVADVAGHPFAQIGVILFCGAWWAVGLPTDILTAALSILAITLTQMVLSRQAERELDAYRRDVAMHTKLDELLMATKLARNEMVGIEELEQEQIEELKDDIRAAIKSAGGDGTDETALAAVTAAVDKSDEPNYTTP